MKGKKILAGIISAEMVFSTMVFPAFADDNTDVYAVGESQTYSDLKTAFDASADNDGDGVITYEIYGKVNLGASGWVSPVKKDSNVTTVNFVGKTNDAEIVIDTAAYTSIDSYQTEDSLIAMNFKDLICSRPEGSWVSDLGHGNNYFIATLRNHGVNFDGTVSYENCTFTNGVCNNFYGNTNFTNCTFKSDPGKSGLWIYGGKDTKVDGESNKFEGARGVKVYCEKADHTGINVTIENAVFNVTERPAIESSMSSKIALKNVDASECAKGLLTSEPKDGREDLNSADITVDGEAPVFAAKVGTKAFTSKDFAIEVAEEKNKTAEPVVAQIGSNAYTTLKDAVTAAQNGDTIKLAADTAENIEIAAGKSITLDLNGKTLTNTENANTITNNGILEITDSSEDKAGKIKNEDTSKAVLFNAGGATAVLNGGTFERSEPKTYYTIKNLGEMTINDGVTVNQFNESSSAVANGCANSSEYTGFDVKLTINGGTFVQGLITIKNDECGVLEINGGNFKNINGNYTVFNWNKAVINGGTFEANYVVGNGRYNDNAIGDVDITNGTFNGIICPDQPAIGYTPYPSEDISISGGSFSTDVSDYCEDGFKAKFINGRYVVDKDDSADTISLKFKQHEDDKTVYDIVLSGDGKNINRLNAAEFTFKLTKENAADDITYEIAAAKDMATISQKDEKYEFHFEGKDGVSDTGAEITIGTVAFEGYGKFKFEATDGRATATTKSDNLVTEFVVGGADGKGTLKIDDEKSVINGEIEVPVQTLTINVLMNHPVNANNYEYQDMSVEISGGDLAGKVLTYRLGDKDGVDADGNTTVAQAANGSYKIEKELTQNRLYSVTVKGAGYRTARYSVTMTEDKTLNVWNNVMTDKIAVVDDTKATKNFLAGDIVRDGTINIYDLSAVVAYFGKTMDTSAYDKYAKYDLNRDGKIDMMDISIVLASWGE